MLARVSHAITLRIGRTLLAAIAAVACGVASVDAQQLEADAPHFTPSIERIRAALQAQQPITSEGDGLDPAKPLFRLGVLTFVPPTGGKFIEVRLPIGDLVSRAAHSVAASQHRRAESAANAEVVKALADFQKTRPK